MYRKIYRLRSQIENGEIDDDKASILLGSILEQAGASGNQDACILAEMADKWLSKHDWNKKNFSEDELAKIAEELQNGTLLDDLELLAWSLAANDMNTIEQYMLGRHEKDGYTYHDIEQYRDDGLVTEHFTVEGNVFVWMRDWWGEEGKSDEIINEVGIIGANKKPKVIDYVNIVDNDSDRADQLRIIIDDLNQRGV